MPEQRRIAVVWGKWGPYHLARFESLAAAYGSEYCLGVALASDSRAYQWSALDRRHSKGTIVTLNNGKQEEQIRALPLGVALYRLLRTQKIAVALLPSYWPSTAFACLLACRLAGVRCVMMNESHAGTERASGLKRALKRCLIRLFSAGLVGGTPQVQHFSNLGMPSEKMFVGYDVVDNDYFGKSAQIVRSNSDHVRQRHGLPERYILSLGRMVEKKNLCTLISAYAHVAAHAEGPSAFDHSLVMIGSGPEEKSLRDQAAALGLRVRELSPGTVPKNARATVFFGGFRQIEENPAFYSLADLFVLPSHMEEWGLVVNEAMACGLPVVVSERAGCAHDLVFDGVNGFRFDPTSVLQLGKCLRDVSLDPCVRERMGSASRTLIAEYGCPLFAENALRAVAASFE